MSRRHGCAALLALALILVACGEGDGNPKATSTSTRAPAPTATATSAPTETPAIPNTSPATELDLPDGFTAYVVAEGLVQPTSVTLGPDNAIYVSQREGPVFRLEDADGDGVFEQKVPYVTGISGIHGIAFAPKGALYVSHIGRISVVRRTDDLAFANTIEHVITDLPHDKHENNGIAFGPDGKLYITNGSTCNDCVEADERSATILQANPDGSDLRVYARGLRNSYDLVFDPQGRLWATDNGADPPCNTIDELNLIEEGGDYGWPYGPACDALRSGGPPVGDLGVNTGTASTLPVADLGFNTASTGIDYYDGEQFPAQYRGDLFITLWGSLEYAPVPGGRILVRAVIDETPEGPRATVEEFGTGFRRPIDVVVDSDGALLVLDFGSGLLYRIVYTGG